MPSVFAHHHVADRIVGVGGVGEIGRIEAGAGVLDIDGDLFRIDVVIDSDNPFALFAMAPLDRVGAEFADGGGELLGLRGGHAAEEEEGAEELVELFEIMGVALQVEADRPLGAVALQIVEPVERLADRLIEAVGGERLGEISVGADLQAVNLVFLIGKGGGHDDGDEIRLAVELEGLADGVAVDVGEHQIEQDDVGRFLRTHSTTDLPSSRWVGSKPQWRRCSDRINPSSCSSSTIKALRLITLLAVKKEFGLRLLFQFEPQRSRGLPHPRYARFAPRPRGR